MTVEKNETIAEFQDTPWTNPDPIKVTALEMAINGSTSNCSPETVIYAAREYEKYLRENTPA